ncbi:hypothetical protein IMZ48_37090 [Candidatus Bathyarchaeota archaeon]|nr:hypothetical protein [Candidatus Bathyarchaeota archaeon]
MMLRLSLLGALWAGGALAQSNHAVGEFRYVGCVENNGAAAKEIPLDPESCTPEACQEACTGYAYAGVYTT